MENLSYLIIKASRILKNSLDKRLSEYNVTAAQFSVLNQILEHDGVITAAEISERLESDRPTISGIISRLEQKGMIERAENPDDKRSSYLKISKGSSELIYHLREISHQLSEDIFGMFNQNQKDDLQNYLMQITKTAEKM